VSRAAAAPHLRMIWTGAGRALPSDDLLNSGSTSNSDASRAPRDGNDHGTTGRTGPASYLSTRTPTSHLPVARLGRQSSRQSVRGRRSVVGAVLSLALVGTAVLSTSSATAAPTPSLKEVEKRIEKLHDQQEQASEDYNTTREQLGSVKVRLAAADKKLAVLKVELAKAKIRVGRLASETYRRGELSTLGLVLGDDPDMALAQAGLLPTLSERQADAMGRLKDSQAKLNATEADIIAQQKKAKEARANLVKTQKVVEKKLAEAQSQLNRLQASDRAAVTNSINNKHGVPSGAGGPAACAGKSVNAASAAGRAAITFACNQIGDPYVWAAAGPDAWDCSGLTMKAFAAGGVSLPHSSRDQANYGTRISVSQARAGDLLFFNYPISHVGISLGDGTMVHAPNSNTVVKVESLYDTPSAAVRL
jgi:peptidoglycan DL-endopeptidase CwlO